MPALKKQHGNASPRERQSFAPSDVVAGTIGADAVPSRPIIAAGVLRSSCTNPAVENGSCVNDSDLAHDRCSQACAVMASSCGDGEGLVLRAARPSPFLAADCTDLLHELSNLLAVVLRNAQMLEWKLPRYSRLKRTALEVARSAQRSDELLRQLRRRCGVVGEAVETANEQPVPVSPLSPWPGTVMESVDDCVLDAVALEPQKHAPSAFDLTAGCDPCTSGAFPKRDDMGRRQISRSSACASVAGQRGE